MSLPLDLVTVANDTPFTLGGTFVAQDTVVALARSETSRSAVVCAELGGFVRVRDTSTGTISTQQSLRGGGDPTALVAFDGLVWVGTVSGLLSVFRADLTPLADCALHESGITALVVHDGVVLSASSDGRLGVWDPRTAECVTCLALSTGPVNALASTYRGVAATDGNDVCLWKLEAPNAPEVVLGGHTAAVVSLLPLQERLLSGSEDETIIIWSLETARPLRTLRSHSGSVHSLLDAGDFVWSSSLEGKVLVWDKLTFTLAGEVPVALTPAKRRHFVFTMGALTTTSVARIWTAATDGVVRSWYCQMNTDGEVAKLQHELRLLRAQDTASRSQVQLLEQRASADAVAMEQLEAQIKSLSQAAVREEEAFKRIRQLECDNEELRKLQAHDAASKAHIRQLEQRCAADAETISQLEARSQKLRQTEMELSQALSREEVAHHRVQQLERGNEDLRQSVNRLKAQLDSATERGEQDQNRIRQMEQIQLQTELSLSDVEVKARLREHDFDDAQQTIAVLRSQLLALQTKELVAQSQIRHLEQDRASCEATVTQLEARLQQLRLCEQDNDELRRSTTSLRSQLSGAESTNEQLQRRVVQLEQLHLQAESTVSDLEGRLRSTTQQLSDAQFEVQTLHARDVAAQSQIRHLEQNRASSEATVAQLEARLQQLRRCEEDNEELRRSSTALRSQLNATEGTNEQLQRRVAQLEQLHLQAESIARNLEARLRSVDQDLQDSRSETRALQTKDLASQAQLHRTEQLRVAAETAASQLEHRVRDCEQELDEAQKSLTALQLQLHVSESEEAHEQSRRRDTEARLVQMQQERDSLAHTVASLKSEVRSATERAAELEQWHLRDMEEMRLQTQHSKTSVEARLQQVQQDRDTLANTVASVKNDLTRSVAERADREQKWLRDLEQLQGQTERSKQDLEARLRQRERECDEAQQTILSIKSQLQALQAKELASDSQIRQLEDERGATESVISQMEGVLQQMRLCEREVDDLRRDAATYKAQLQASEAREAKEQQALAAAEAEVQRLTAKVNALLANEASIQQSEQESIADYLQCSDALAHSAAELDNVKDALALTKEMLATAESDKRTLVAKLRETSEVIMALKSRATTAEAEVERRDRECAALRLTLHECETKLRDHDEVVGQLRQEILHLKAYRKQDSEELLALQHRLGGLDAAATGHGSSARRNWAPADPSRALSPDFRL